MKVFNIVIPKNDPLTNYEIWKYARKLGIPHFRTVCILNTLPAAVKSNECGIVNLNRDLIGWCTGNGETCESILILMVKSLHWKYKSI